VDIAAAVRSTQLIAVVSAVGFADVGTGATWVGLRDGVEDALVGDALDGVLARAVVLGAELAGDWLPPLPQAATAVAVTSSPSASAPRRTRAGYGGGAETGADCWRTSGTSHLGGRSAAQAAGRGGTREWRLLSFSASFSAPPGSASVPPGARAVSCDVKKIM
jgi:hypothetical protein